MLYKRYFADRPVDADLRADIRQAFTSAAVCNIFGGNVRPANFLVYDNDDESGRDKNELTDPVEIMDFFRAMSRNGKQD